MQNVAKMLADFCELFENDYDHHVLWDVVSECGLIVRRAGEGPYQTHPILNAIVQGLVKVRRLGHMILFSLQQREDCILP